MSVWSDTIYAQDERLAAMSDEALASFAIACVDHAFWAYYRSFQDAFADDPSRLSAARCALDVLWNTRHTAVSESELRETLARVEQLVPEADSPEAALDGWVFLLTGIYSALHCVLQEDTLLNAKYAAENAFLAIREREANRFMRVHSTHLNQFNEHQLEQEAPALAKEVAFQLGNRPPNPSLARPLRCGD